jgi:flagellar hook-basal body complex protein FliE
MDKTDPLPKDVDSTNKIEALEPLGEDQHGIGSEAGSSFASIMDAKKEASSLQLSGQGPSAISPFDLAKSQTKPISTPNVDTLMTQVDLAHSTMSTIKTQLSHPNLELKPSQKYLVKNKLSDANANLRAANTKLGVEPKMPEEIEPSKASGPISQYLNYVTDGISQLNAAKRQLSTISAQGANLSPAEFMLVQLKVNKAQQELDFTSAVLGKTIEGFKSIMNVQI